MLTVLTYNIHKGFNRYNRDFVLHRIRHQLESVDVDVVFLQEIQGHHYRHQKRIASWPAESQFEFLADNLWPHFSYGKNAIYDYGHHGNAILSKYHFDQHRNVNLSRFQRASRSFLHGVMHLPDKNIRVNLICIHMEIVGFERQRQFDILRRYLDDNIDDSEPVIIAGDFNDWSGRTGQRMESLLAMREVYRHTHGRYARTFPSHWPVLQMDRVFYRNIRLLDCECLDSMEWRQLSDHLPLYAHFEF